MIPLLSALLSLATIVPFPQDAPAASAADLILVGGHVVTVDAQTPEAEAIAIRGDRILAVGTSQAIRALADEHTQVIDLAGRLAIPGFIDGHAHLKALGDTKQMLDLTHATAWEDIEQQVAEAVAKTPKGQWILGRGWHQEKWNSPPNSNVEGYPTHARLSALSPDHPVILIHASGHMCFANAAAMRAAHVDADTASPEGGEILRNPDGTPCGAFREKAAGLIWDAYEAPASGAEPESTQHAVHLAVQDCLSKGVTSFQDAGSSFETIAILRDMAESGDLGIRLWVMVRDEPERMAKKLGATKVTGAADGFFTVGGIKLILDGALGSHGAWLLEPYSDLPESSGLNTAPLEVARRYADLAIQYNMQLCVHAIGDRANREILDVFEANFAKHPTKASRRWRVEHAQHIDPADIPRFAELGVIASMQGVHCTSDGVFVPERLGETRSKNSAYVWRELLDSGAVVSNGTDAPVEDIDPIASFYASVTRKMPNGKAFYPEHCMTRAEALKSYTLSCAYAAFEE
ncbi:MAG TPA: amidohydrolase, partial [Planctomycetota bacterium]|nr:amidohydrolase [Planctomycetota bacterium]